MTISERTHVDDAYTITALLTAWRLHKDTGDTVPLALAIEELHEMTPSDLRHLIAAMLGLLESCLLQAGDDGSWPERFAAHWNQQR